MKPICFILLLFLSLLYSCSLKNNDQLFELIDPEKSGITFVNTITETDSMNVLEFMNVYTGGGVGVGDLNNDGLNDVFFGGNMTSSKLYLNKSKPDQLLFEDITSAAGLITNQWITGITMVDINQDGLLDIYLCASGSKIAKKRENKLFINEGITKGIPHFREAGAEYGLNDNSYTTQAAFFDYDRDGDLDVLLIVNEAADYLTNKVNLPILKKKPFESARANRLYKNTQSERATGLYTGSEKFINVTQAAGLTDTGYNLGLSISDLNTDGWPDIYITSDFLPNDAVYINNGNGTFTNKVAEYLKHSSYAGMGVDIADFNNDKLTDVAVVDMIPEDNRRMKSMLNGMNYDRFMMNIRYGYAPQYSRNTLQLNNGNISENKTSFSDIGPMAGIHHTDWSWSILFGDYDNDGWKDLFITNGFLRDMQDLDFVKFGLVTTLGDVGDNTQKFLKLVKELPPVKVPNYIYKNTGNLNFKDMTQTWGLQQPTVSSGAIYNDLDNDGDLDLVVSNTNAPASVYNNRLSEQAEKANFLKINFAGSPTNRNGIGAKVEISTPNHIQVYENFLTRGFQSAVTSGLHIGLGKHNQVNNLKVTWPDGKQQVLTGIPANTLLTLHYKNAIIKEEKPPVAHPPLFTEVSELYDLNYKHQEEFYHDFNVQRIMPFKLSQNGPGIAAGDVNGDGLDDFYVGGSTGYPGTLFKQNKDNTFQRTSLNDNEEHEDTGSLLLDADKDGDLDLYVVSGSVERNHNNAYYQDRLYVNDGTGNFNRHAKAIPEFNLSGSCVTAADFDKDGDLDLFIGGRSVPGQYPLPTSSKLLLNETKEKDQPLFIDATARLLPNLTNIGMVTSAIWTDYNNDTWTDLIIVGEGMPITLFKNDKGKFSKQSSLVANNARGFWNSIIAEDFDTDGDMDYVIGNMGLNSLLKTSKEQPVCIYAKDFDENGSIDPVLCYYLKGKNVPFHPRDEFIDQMPSLRGKFIFYSNYAAVTISDVFKPEQLKQAYQLVYETFQTSYLQNNGKNGFTLKSMPVPTQISPTNGMVADDFDEDGIVDLLMVGNSYAPSLTLGFFDASIGHILKGKGDGTFTMMPPSKTGFYADKDAKAAVELISADRKPVVIISNNKNALNTYQLQNSSTILSLQPLDAWAEITYKDGRKYKKEFQYGAGYLSQSARHLKVTTDMNSIKVIDFSGKVRAITPNNFYTRK